MKFSDLKQSILQQFTVEGGNKFVPFIVGKPGGGKSSCAREIAESLAARLGIPPERIVEFNPSLRESCDILGLPQMDGDHTKWLPPEELWNLREGVGPCVLIIEELSDATMDMQNPMCRVILDRYAGQMRLSRELYIIATGNRPEDRSGAQRLSTKLANRMRTLQFDEDLEDWCAWAAEHDVNPVLRAFIRFRPNLLSDFDPSRSCNPTPRAWEDVSRIPMEMKQELYAEHVAGAVGSGAAAEWLGFLRIFNELPDMDEVLKNPATAEVPTKPDVLFAVTAKVATMLTKRNVEKLYQYIQRLPAEFQVMLFSEAIKTPSLKWIDRTKAYQDFALKHIAVLSGSV